MTSSCCVGVWESGVGVGCEDDRQCWMCVCVSGRGVTMSDSCCVCVCVFQGGG